jgi:Fe-coproporphyrin III synthase
MTAASASAARRGVPARLPHLFIRLLDTCNLECAHCYASCGPSAKPALDLDAVLDIVDQLPGLNVRTVHLEGGEALIHRDIWTIIDALNSKGIRPAITSNGLSTKRAMLERLVGKVSRMTFSIDGHNALTHDKIRRRIGSFDRVVNAVRDSVDLGISTHMISVMWKESAPHVDKVVELAESLRVGRLLLFGCGKIGAAVEHWDELACDDATWFRFLRDARELAAGRPWVWFELDRVPRDSLAEFLPADYRPYCMRLVRDSLIIDPKGDVYPCGYFIPVGRRLGNVREDRLATLLERPPPGERFSGACKDPHSFRGGDAVPLCKLYSVNADTLAK